MDDETTAIAALERVLLTVEAELMALHAGTPVDLPALDARLSSQLTVPESVPAVAAVAAPSPPPAVAPPAPNLPPPPARPTPPPPPPPPGPMMPPRPASAPRGLTLEWLFRVGGIALVVLAAVFFVSTAISRGWIGPTAQLVLATSVSLGIVAQSFRFSPDRQAWRITMAAGGAAAFFVSGVVGHLGLDLLSTGAALAWLGAAVVGFLGLARAHDSELIAALGAPAAALGAVLVAASADAADEVLLAVGIGWATALAVATATQRWFVARALGAAVGAAVIAFGVGAAVADGVTVLAVAGTALGLLVIAALAAQQLGEFDPSNVRSLIEARVAAATLPWAALVVALVVSVEFGDTAAGWTAVGIGLVGAVLAHFGQRAIDPTMAMLHQLAGIGTSVLGFFLVLDGPSLLAVLLLQAIVTGALAARTRSAEMIVAAALLGGLVTAWTVALTAAALGGAGFPLGELLATGAVVATAFVGAWMLRNTLSGGGSWMVVWVAALTWVVAAWQTVPQEQMWVSLTWALMGVGLLASRSVWTGTASAAQFRTAVHTGLATLALTGGKLIFVDLVAVDVLWRAGLFMAVGAVFLRLAFVLPDLLDRTAEPSAERRDESVG